MSDSVWPHRWKPTRLPAPGILQATRLEWVAISFSSAWKWKVKVKSLSHVRLLATPWTTAYQTPPSMGFSRQKYWSGLPLPSPHGPLGRCNSNCICICRMQHPLSTNIKTFLTNLIPHNFIIYFSLLGSSVHGILEARILEWVAIFLLPGIFLTKELNPGLLRCSQIFYQLSYEESQILKSGKQYLSVTSSHFI